MKLSIQTVGEGRPIVVLPGFGLDQAVMMAAFEPAFTGEAAKGWRRLYLDLPGCGESPKVEPTSDAVLDAIQQTIEAELGPAEFLAAGTSYGGYLAAGLARRLPEQVRGLMLVCPGIKLDPAERNLTGVLPSEEPEPGWLDGTPEDLREHFTHGIGRQTRAVADRVARAFAEMGPKDEEYLERLRSTGYQLSDEGSPLVFDGQVSMLAGRRDRIAGYLNQFEAMAHHPKGTFAAVWDCGHYLPFERPELFAALILDWLAGSEPEIPDLRGRP